MTYYNIDNGHPSERHVRALDASEDYRILRRLPRAREFWCKSMPVPTSTTTIGVVDCETTGLDAGNHKLIEIAIAKLVICDKTGDVVDVREPRSWCEDPGEPLTFEIEQLTGLCDADLHGQAFDRAVIDDAFDDCDVLVSHNARFDRSFLIRRFPHLQHPWACSFAEIAWSNHNFGMGRNLGGLLTAAGHFPSAAHRAAPDSWALTCLLAMHARDGRAIAAHLLQTARKSTKRMHVLNLPFSSTAPFRSAGYRWNPVRKSWWFENDAERIDHESAWARSISPVIRVEIETLDWFDRHSR